jgi:hypothetical protein
MLLEAIKASEANILDKIAQLQQNTHVTKVKTFDIDSDGSEDGINEEINLIIKEVTSGRDFKVQNLHLFDNIAEVKERIEQLEGIPSQGFRLIYNGKTLREQYNLKDYNVKDGSVLHLLIRLQGGGIFIQT